ncbi:IS21-like element ISBlo1 family helper ATPase IstB [Bifidobacterium pullorum]
MPGRAVENATPGQLGFLAALFTAENASRAESKRNRLLRQAGFPQSKELDGYDWSMAAFPTDWGREQLVSLEFIDRAEDLVLYGDVGCGKTHLAIAIGTLACRRGIPVRFFTASGLIMRLRKAKTENRLDQELKTIGKADLLVIERARIPAHRHRRRQAPVPGSSPTATKGEASSSPRTSSSADGATCSATATWPPPSSTASTRHGRIIRFHGESYRNTHSLMK